MGSAYDPMAVVNPATMNVHGFEDLAVVDASVMPSLGVCEIRLNKISRNFGFFKKLFEI